MAHSPDRPPAKNALLDLFRAATAPLTMADLRAAGIERPAQAVYDLQRAGYRVVRTAVGLELFEGPERPPQPAELPPRVRLRTPRPD